MSATPTPSPTPSPSPTLSPSPTPTPYVTPSPVPCLVFKLTQSKPVLIRGRTTQEMPRVDFDIATAGPYVIQLYESNGSKINTLKLYNRNAAGPIRPSLMKVTKALGHSGLQITATLAPGSYSVVMVPAHGSIPDYHVSLHPYVTPTPTPTPTPTH